MTEINTTHSLVEKWAPVLNEESAGKIKDQTRVKAVAAILENQERANAEQRELNETVANTTSSAANWDPVLIALARRAMPNMMAFDVASVQPMSGPTGLIFAMRSRYDAGTTGSTEALFNEANTQHTGDSSGTQTQDPSGLSGLTDSNSDSSLDNDRIGPDFAAGMATADGEALGSNAGGSVFS